MTVTSITPPNTIGPIPSRPIGIRASVSVGSSQVQRSNVGTYEGMVEAARIAGTHAPAIIAAPRHGEGGSGAATAIGGALCGGTCDELDRSIVPQSREFCNRSPETRGAFQSRRLAPRVAPWANRCFELVAGSLAPRVTYFP